MKSEKKNPYDKTSTKRAQALIARIKESGGAVVTLRANGDLLRQIDELVAAGEAKSRPDLLAKLVRAKYAEQTVRNP